MLSFHHLTIFETLMRVRSVTLAAETLDLPQATLSRNLKILRDHFDDPLFVRTSKGMEPTTLAQNAAPAVSEALQLYRLHLSGGGRFEAATSRRNFLIAASDVGHLLVLPALERFAAEAAPNIRMTAVPLGRSKLLAQLEAGEVDIAIGSFPNLFAGVREQTLFREEYICVVPARSGAVDRFDLEAFKAARHIVVDGGHLGHIHQEVERRIVELVGEDRVRITSESFLLSAHLAEQSDLVLTVPSRVARIVTRSDVALLRPPIDLPGFDVKQYWHERFDHDPGNVWLRHALARMRAALA